MPFIYGICELHDFKSNPQRQLRVDLVGSAAVDRAPPAPSLTTSTAGA